MSKCPFPECWRDEHEDGEHQLGRPPQPRGTLRCAVEYRSGRVRCQFGVQPWDRGFSPEATHGSAIGFFVDMLGFGWDLCYGCVQRFGARDAELPDPRFRRSRPRRRRPQDPRPLTKVMVCHEQDPHQVQPGGKVIPFARREQRRTVL